MAVTEEMVEAGANAIHRAVKTANKAGAAPNVYELARTCLEAAMAVSRPSRTGEA